MTHSRVLIHSTEIKIIVHPFMGFIYQIVKDQEANFRIIYSYIEMYILVARNNFRRFSRIFIMSNMDRIELQLNNQFDFGTVRQ